MFLVWQFQFLWDLVLSARDAHIKMEAVHTKIYVKTCSVCKQVYGQLIAGQLIAGQLSADS